MGNIYYRKDASEKKWRVQIRHLGVRNISRSFHTKEEAEEFLEKANKIIQHNIKIRKNDEAFETLRN